MEWLSSGSDVLIDRVIEAGKNKQYLEWPIVIIGSGYGGAVAASRLARANVGKICLLERGKEYLPGEFPNDIGIAPGHIRFDRWDAELERRRDNALFDFRFGRGVTTLTGCALGGTSQINANVALRADPRVFQSERWPVEIRRQFDPLDAHYTTVEQWLQVAMKPGWTAGRPVKYRQLKRLQKPVQKMLDRYWRGRGHNPDTRCKPAPIAVTLEEPGGENPYGVRQHACVGCGDCVTGCNHWAKNTLTMNYLPDAVRQGNVEIYTGVDVVRLELNPDSKADGCRYRIRFNEAVETALGRGAQAGCEEPPKRGEAPQARFEIRASAVILAGGVLGSPEILMRSAEGDNGLHLSERLGESVSLNGDSIAFGYDQKQEVNAIGWGAARRDRHADHDSIPSGCDPKQPWRGVGPEGISDQDYVGPTITGVLDTRHGLPLHEGAVLEDGIIPGAIREVLHEWLTTGSLMAQLADCEMRGEKRWRDVDPLAPSEKALRHTQTYLLVAHDPANGRIRMRNDKAFIDWPEATNDSNPRHETMLRNCESLGGIFLDNPALRPIPKKLASALSGVQLRGSYLSVHPLGGAPMGDDFTTGVVNHYGAVYDGRYAESVHEGLFVLDGSIVPTSLGANPFLTIAALAERAIPHVVKDLETLFNGPVCSVPARGTEPMRLRSFEQARMAPQTQSRVMGNVDEQFPIELPALPDPPPKSYTNPNQDGEGAKSDVEIRFRETLRSFTHQSAHAPGVQPDYPLRGPSLTAARWFELSTSNGGKLSFDPGEPVAAALELEVGPRGIDALLADPNHEFEKLTGTLRIAKPGVPRSSGTEMPVVDYAEYRVVSPSSIRILARRESGTRWSRIIRAATTWYEARGKDDLASQYLRQQWSVALHAAVRDWTPSPVVQLARTSVEALIGMIRLNYHAGERREFRYDLHLHNAVDESRMRLIGVKDLQYPVHRVATCALVRALRFAFRTQRTRKDRDVWKTFGANWWRRLTELEVEIQSCNPDCNVKPVIAGGRMRVDLVRFAHDNVAQIASVVRVPDTPRALLALARVGLLFFRVMLKTHFWDFKAPEYANPTASRDLLPDRHKGIDPANPTRSGIFVFPKRILFSVPDRDDPQPGGDRSTATGTALGASGAKNVKGTASDAGADRSRVGVTLCLTRYAANACDPTVPHEPILLLHGFAQSSCAFVNPDVDEDLVTSLLKQGYDVWLLDYRHSIALQSSREVRDLDEAARYDVRGAIEEILKYYDGSKLLPRGQRRFNDVTVFGHCMGAVLVAMAALSGRLEESPPGAGSLIKKAVLSQVPPFLVGGYFSQFKIELAAFIRDYLKVDVVNLSARGEPSMWLTVADRLMGTIPIDDEVCPHEFNRFGRQPQLGVGTCKRISSIIGRLYRHENIGKATHDRLPRYFGWANIAVFAQIAKFFQYERIVDANGADVYLSRDNIRSRMNFPILFLHGRENVVFDVESAHRSCLEFRAANPSQLYGLEIIDGYAHYDCIIGKNAARDVFDKVNVFLKGGGSQYGTVDDSVDWLSGYGWKQRMVVPEVGPWLTRLEEEDGTLKATIKSLPSRQWSVAAGDTYAFQLLDQQPNRLNPVQWHVGENTDRGRSGDRPGRTFVQTVENGVLHFESPGKGLTPRTYWVADPVDFPTNPVLSMSGAELYRQLQRHNEWLHAVSKEPESRSLSRRLLDPQPLDDAKIDLSPRLLEACRRKDAIAFFISCCRHPGTGFERTLSDMAFGAMADRLDAAAIDMSAGAVYPQLCLLVGDQIYADAMAGVFDTDRPIEKYVVRYLNAFGSRRFRTLARRLPLHMAIDDHEIEDNFSLDMVESGARSERILNCALQSARAFQGSISKKDPRQALLWDCLSASDFEFFIADTRSNRNRRPSQGEPRLMSSDGWVEIERWLKRQARSSRPKFVVSGSVVLPRSRDVIWAHRHAQERQNRIPGELHPEVRWDSWSAFPEEQRKLFDLIVKYQVDNVVFVSGDYHVAAHSALTLKLPGGASDLHAHSVVAPPAYAPFPFANERSGNFPEEDRLRFKISSGTLMVEVSTRAWDGSGFGEVCVRQEGGRWTVGFSCFDQTGRLFPLSPSTTPT